jgi:DNA-binding transcriptional MerR regulator
MLIGELVSRTGISKDTIRFYEKKGLIQLNRDQRRSNNYKDYPDQVFERLIMIKNLKELGFSLKEIDAYMYAFGNEASTCEDIKFAFKEKVKQIEFQLQNLSQLRERLLCSLANCYHPNCANG